MRFLIFIKVFISLYDVSRHLCAMVTEVWIEGNLECQSSLSSLFERRWVLLSLLYVSGLLAC